MKKPYSLDYSINTDVERVQAIKELLDNLTYEPSASDLELFANYILNKKTLTQSSDVTEDYTRRYKHWVSKDARHESLDAILDNPLSSENELQPLEEKYVYVKRRRTVSRRTDGDIPGMKELWESIDRIQHIVNVNEGKVPLDISVPLIESQYRLYQLKHNLIDLRAIQYDLLEAYKPVIYFKALTPPQSPELNWGSDSAYWISRDEWEHKLKDPKIIGRYPDRIEKYETRFNPYTGLEEIKWHVQKHNFDWENYQHIQILTQYYSRIYEQLWDKPDSWGRTLIYDYDRYVQLAHIPPSREYMLLRRIDGAAYEEIAPEVNEKFGLDYSSFHIASIIAHDIPLAMAAAAKRQRLLVEAKPWDRKRCRTCGKLLPKDSLFFSHNRARPDGWMTQCKDCETIIRHAKKGGKVGDGRYKDPQMSQVQTRPLRS